MKSLREILAASHIAAVAIAVLIFFSLNAFVHALIAPLSALFDFLITAIAIGGEPYVSSSSSALDPFIMVPALFYLFSAVMLFGAAWLLSRWVYGVGPFACLKRYRPILTRRTHV